jgi:biopolymer transport protein ExbD
MKLRVGQKIHYESGPDMTPLVDVVMVLLIFLMMVGSFAAMEHYLQSNLPLRQTGGGAVAMPESGLPDEPPLEVRVDSPTPDRFIARLDGRPPVNDTTSLANQLRSVGDGLVSAGRARDEIQLTIAPSRNVRLQHVLDVFQAAQMAGFKRIGFTTAR